MLEHKLKVIDIEICVILNYEYEVKITTGYILVRRHIMDVDGKMAAIHAVAGIVAGYLSFLLSTGAIAGIGRNEVLAVLVALIILYAMGQASERLFGKEKVGGAKGWLWSGIVPFFFVWIMVWVIFYNL